MHTTHSEQLGLSGGPGAEGVIGGVIGGVASGEGALGWDGPATSSSSFARGSAGRATAGEQNRYSRMMMMMMMMILIIISFICIAPFIQNNAAQSA